MSISYHPPSTTATQPRRPLPGTRHISIAWTASVRSVRAALTTARLHAPTEHVLSGEALAELAIDLTPDLEIRDRALLAVVLGDLARLSRRDANNGQQLNLFSR